LALGQRGPRVDWGRQSRRDVCTEQWHGWLEDETLGSSGTRSPPSAVAIDFVQDAGHLHAETQKTSTGGHGRGQAQQPRRFLQSHRHRFEGVKSGIAPDVVAAASRLEGPRCKSMDEHMAPAREPGPGMCTAGVRKALAAAPRQAMRQGNRLVATRGWTTMGCSQEAGNM